MKRDPVVEETRVWIERVVVGLGLCPFAEASIAGDGLKFVHMSSPTVDELTAALRDGVLELRSAAGKKFDSLLLIHPNVLTDFYAYNDFLARAEQVLEETGSVGDFQIASFHPRYQFAGTDPEDVENYTNRSPYPMLHLLRESSVERALANFQNPDDIPKRNVERLRRLGRDGIEKLLSGCRSDEAP